MRHTRREVLAATVSTAAIAGCTGESDATDSPGGEEGGDGGAGGARGTTAATPTDAPTEPPGQGTEADGDSPLVRIGSHPDLGEILVDSEGMTLYNFDSDTRGERASTCDGGCAEAWPPLTVADESTATAGPNVSAELTTFEREDGSLQVAANGWPLYYFASDEGPGDANGQGANDVWWVLRPDGTAVRSTGGTETATATGNVTETDSGGYDPAVERR
ncbi:COG4315 family predicted lipoprotein [Halosimplex marinum]|uniref:COG4315 family predicted lipoprotein n=1 Tax=Halosimplex marinum TaxID=3396620 RepID=UPI003F5492E5